MPQELTPNPTPPPERSAGALLKKAYERLIKIRGNPREIALGFALGLFVGMSPTMGFQTAIAIFFAALFKWNKISAAIAVWISNPLTAPVLYGMTYYVGAAVFGIANGTHHTAHLGDATLTEMILKAPEIFWVLTLGGVVVGVPVAVAGYFFAFTAVNRYREDIARKLAERKARRAVKKQGKRRKKIRKKAVGP